MKRSVIKWSLLLLFALTNAKVNANSWTHKVDTTNGRQINYIFSAQDGGFWAIGSINDTISGFQTQTGNTNPGRDTVCIRTGGMLQKYNADGFRIFEKVYYSTNNTEKLIFNNLIECKDGSGLIIHYTKEIWSYHTVFMGNLWYWNDNGSAFAKVDNNGNVINANINLEIPYTFTGHPYLENSYILGISGAVTGATHSPNPDSTYNTYQYKIAKTNYNGVKIADVIKQTIIVTPGYFSANNVFHKLSDGNYLSISNLYSSNAYIIIINPDNYSISYKVLPFSFDYTYLYNNSISSDSNYIYLHGYDENTQRGLIFKINYNGDSIAKAIIPLINYDNYKEFYFRKVGGKVQLVRFPSVEYNTEYQRTYDIYTFNDDMSYSFQQKRTKIIDNYLNANTDGYDENYPKNIILLKDNSFVSKLFYSKPNDGYFYALAKLDTIVTESKISGTIFGDKNNNCSTENSDALLRNYALRAINSSDSFYTSTDTLGNYEMYLDSGNYQLQLLPNPSYPLWKLQNCSIPSTIQLNDGDSATIDIGLTPIISCTNLTVSLTAPMLRRCFENTYYVNYCNNGTVNATNAYIDVTLDPYLDFNTSAQAFTNLGNNVFRFFVGNVETGKCGSFSFTATVNCDSTILGQTHCTEAHIFPDTVCSPVPYNGAIIRATATCKTNKVEFKLKNIGGNMQSDRKYIVIQDQVLRSIQNYNLPSGNELIVDVPLQSGATYRIEAEQPANFPSFLGDPKVAAFIEGCRANANDTFTTGIISQFPLFDGEPYRAIDCQQNRGSYDPNDKAAKPTGVSAEHFIDKNIPLDYTIRFQNTGTDTAFTVSILDTISPYLDINSIQLSATSHLCNMIRRDTNVIQFLFNNIKLVDSTTNTIASNGFVQFHIQQKNNNTLGTVINNNASIYFDYNPAIVTNTVFHTIGENYLRIDLISSTINEAYKNVELLVFPNPFREKATLIINNAELKNPRLLLMDINGKLLDIVESVTKNQIIIYRNQLNAGLYIYKLLDGNTEVATGKIILQ